MQISLARRMLEKQEATALTSGDDVKIKEETTEKDVGVREPEENDSGHVSTADTSPSRGSVSMTSRTDFSDVEMTDVQQQQHQNHKDLVKCNGPLPPVSSSNHQTSRSATASPLTNNVSQSASDTSVSNNRTSRVVTSQAAHQRKWRPMDSSSSSNTSNDRTSVSASRNTSSPSPATQASTLHLNGPKHLESNDSSKTLALSSTTQIGNISGTANDSHSTVVEKHKNRAQIREFMP